MSASRKIAALKLSHSGSSVGTDTTPTAVCFTAAERDRMKEEEED